MSRFKVEEVCFELRKSANADKFKSDPDSFLASYPLAEEEKQSVRNGDLGALYKMGVTYGAIAALSRVFGYDDLTYVRRLRAAAGFPEIKKQIEVLEKRAQRRRQ